jgi:diadenosine tetraphosphate (Ap4A) HIT family hydrolase
MKQHESNAGDTVIHRRVAMANAGKHPSAIIKLKSGWVVMADTQPVEGYCLILSDPVVKDLNAMSEAGRAQYCLDMTRVGDALLAIQGAARINYETWGNLDPALHTHIVPRYTTEPEDKRTLPVVKGYDPKMSRAFDPVKDQAFIEKMRDFLRKFAAG